MSAPDTGFEVRFGERVRRRGGWSEGDTLVLAVSGGLDSTVLLHLLRFTSDLPASTLLVAHLDHAMRPGSEDDARWLKGLTRAWGVPLEAERLRQAPANEAEARRARYAFLERVRREAGARRILTAHQADDQAETVLFRAVRGAAIGGLRGIRESPTDVIWRPLLPFFRAELEAYATRVGLSWREDPTNREPRPRNVLRHRVLPTLETAVARGARRSLVRLATRARENETAWRHVLPTLLVGADVRVDPQGISVDRKTFVGYHPAVRARLVRHMAHRLGAEPSGVGTRQAVEFTSSGASGREVPLGGDVVLRRDLDRLVVCAPREPASAEVAQIPDASGGSSRAIVGGRLLQVTWSRQGTGGPVEESFDVASLRFPLVVRGWRAGDRVRLPYGGKKVKKLLLEARIPASHRDLVPVVADGHETVLWVPGVARSARARPGDGDEALFIRIDDAPID